MGEERTVRLRSRLLLAELMSTANNGKGFSYREMAERCSCGKTMIGNLVTGEDETCTESLGDRIAEVLRVDARILFVPDESVKRGRRPSIAAKIEAPVQTPPASSAVSA